MNIPNTLSMLRICAVPVLIWLVMNGAMEAAFWLCCTASLTDALDGYIARRFDMHTRLGSYLDPIADKMLLVSGFIVLTVAGLMPLWITLLVVTRDVIIIGGAILYQTMTGSLQMEPLWISKLNTTMQITLLLLVLFAASYPAFTGAIVPITVCVAITTVISGWRYVSVWTQRAISRENITP